MTAALAAFNAMVDRVLAYRPSNKKLKSKKAKKQSPAKNAASSRKR